MSGRSLSLLFSLLLCCGTVISFGQARGGDAEIKAAAPGVGKIRAVIAGVSTYRNLPGRQLNFADDDAEAFYQFLSRHPSADKKGIIKLIDTLANKDNFLSGINGLIQKSAKGDVIIVYFAGHGNVQRDIGKGFLLFSDVPEKDGDYFAGDALNLDRLKECAELCGKREIKFIVVTDACRSGKLLDGSTQTLAVLNSEWNFTAKLLSCEANQSSYEDPELKHGLFTYYLLQALEGLFEDENSNGIVELGELKNSFTSQEMRVKFKRPPPQGPQTPAFSGLSDFQIIDVDPKQKQELLARLEEQKKNPNADAKSGSAGEGRGLDEYMEASLSIPEVYTFYNCLADNYLVPNPYDKKIRIKTGEPTQVKAHNGVSYCVAVSPNEKWAAVGGKESNTKVFGVANGKLTGKHFELPGEPDIHVISFSADSKFIITGSLNGTLTVWELGDKAHSTATVKLNGIWSMSISHDGKRIAVGTASGKIQLLGLPDLKLLDELTGHSERIVDLRFSGNDSTLYSASHDKTVKIWSIYKKGPVKTFTPGHKSALNAMEIGANGDHVFTGDDSGAVIVWNVAANKPVNRMNMVMKNAYKPNVTDLSISRDGRQLLVAGNQSYLSLFSADSLKESVPIFVKSKFGMTMATFSMSGNSIFASSLGGDLYQVAVQLPPSYAADIYESNFVANITLSPIRARLQSDFIAKILAYSQQVIEPFIAGRDVHPKMPAIHKAILGLEYASNLNVQSQFLEHEIHVRLVYLKGMKILEENNFQKLDEALGYFNEVNKLEPDATYPHNAISLVLKRKNEIAKANASLNTASQQLPTWTEPKSNLGKNHLSDGNFDAAQKSFTEIVAMQPEISKGYRWMGELYFLQGDLQKAEEAWRKGLTKDPGSSLLMSKISLVESNRRRYGKAEELLKRSRELDSTFYLPHLYLGDLNLNYYQNHHRNSKYLATAAVEYKRAMSLSSEVEPACYLALGRLCFVLSQTADPSTIRSANVLPPTSKSADPSALLELALTYLDKAIKLSPHEGEAYYYKARVRKAITKIDNEGLAVLSDFKTATRGGYESLLAMSRFYYDVGQYENAEKAATEAIKANRKFYEPYLVILPAFVKQKKWSAIKSAEEEIQKSWPRNPMVMTALAGSLAFAPNESSRAAHLCDQVLKSNSTYLPALITRNTLNQKPMSISELETEMKFPYSATRFVGKTLLSITVDGIIYLADISGRILSPFPYTPVATLGEDFMVVKNERSKFGVTNFQGDTLISVQYDKIEPANDYVLVTRNRLVGLYTPEMKKLMEVKYQAIQVHEDAIFYQVQDRWGAADLAGKTIVRPTYSKVSLDKHNLQRVIKAENKTLTHYYNFTGKCLNCR